MATNIFKLEWLLNYLKAPVKINEKTKYQTIEYSNMENEIKSIKDSIEGLDKKPILNLIINDVESDTRGIYDIIREELGDLALMIRPKFHMLGEKSIDELFDDDNVNIGPKELIIKQLEDYGDDNVNQLALDLYDYLSKDKIDESKDLIEQFYSEFYDNSKDYEEAPHDELEDVEETLDEVLK